MPPGAEADAALLLELERAKLRSLPSGVEHECFSPRPLSGGERLALWRRWRVEQPRGWDQSGRRGSIAYGDEKLAPVRAGGPVFVCVGRYTAVKRLPLLISAHARAVARLGKPAPLVLVGGHPGEWEGEHPADAIAASGARRVFLAGWHGHDALPEFFGAAEVNVLASVREQFGSVLVEGMACELPAVAVNRFGPAAIIEDGVTGWLVEPDDERALSDAIVAALADPGERRRRGRRARRAAEERFSWPAIAGRLALLFDEVADVADGRLATPGTAA